MFSVVEDDPDAPKGRREVARSAARQADFVLPPGTYYVVARQGGVGGAREPGALRPATWCGARSTWPLAAWRWRPAERRCAPAAGDVVSYRVERLDGPAPEVVTTSRPSPVLVLPDGRYRVEGRYGP